MMDRSCSFTAAEQMIVAMAREIEDGECLAFGIGTSLPSAAYLLAKLTHAPHCVFLCSVGGSFSVRTGQLTLTDMEGFALTQALRHVSYTEIVCDQLPALRFKEFSRPAQVDRFGNTNNLQVTTKSGRTLRLPGVGGVPDFSGYESHHAYLYVPRHDPATLVQQLEFCSGVGARWPKLEPARLPSHGQGTRKLVTDLCVIAFSPKGATLESIHDGVPVEAVIQRTGFRLELSGPPRVTERPTREELRLIRERIDPGGVREFEMMPSRQRQSILQSTFPERR